MVCPCGSGLNYEQCCAPFHNKYTAAPSAEALMRSRYSAYALKNSAYLVQTTAPQTRVPEDTIFLAPFFRNSEWVLLELVDVRVDEVEFKAFYKESGVLKLHHERSRFERLEQWYYVDGDILPSKIERNRKCPCGSGKKYKQCCA